LNVGSHLFEGGLEKLPFQIFGKALEPHENHAVESPLLREYKLTEVLVL
jgi:hypothetical protein